MSDNLKDKNDIINELEICLELEMYLRGKTFIQDLLVKKRVSLDKNLYLINYLIIFNT